MLNENVINRIYVYLYREHRHKKGGNVICKLNTKLANYHYM